MTDPKISRSPVLRRGDFGTRFRWGCSTSAYQIEGATELDGRGLSIWDVFCAQPGRIKDGSSGAVACDHYRRREQDLDLAREIGINAYRFSIAWPRIFPNGTGREPNAKGMDFYSRLVDELLERGIEPWPTLYHWDLPQALQEKGGWGSRDTASAFADFVLAMGTLLGDRVKHWITHNEPWCSAFLGHQDGSHAPGMCDTQLALQACHHILLSHGLAVDALRTVVADAKAGIALSLHPITPASDSEKDRQAAIRHDGMRNRWFLDPLHGGPYPRDILALLGDLAPEVREGDLAVIATPVDFLGVNYYFAEVVADAPGVGPIFTRVIKRPGVERTAFGWEVSPESMVDLLKRLAKDYAPPSIQITENGSTYDDVTAADGRVHDVQRRDYLKRHLSALRNALDLGIPVHGYFAWSLLDNFEWAEGYTRRFGLIHVDYETQRRRLKLSGEWYRDFLYGSPDANSDT